MKTAILVSNWKLNMSVSDSKKYFSEFSVNQEISNHCNIIFLLPAYIFGALHELARDSLVRFGGQNIYAQPAGAFTGENSVSVLAELGGKYCLVGHSERRLHFAESDDFIAQKMKICHAFDITPILCVGETLVQRNLNLAKEVIENQIRRGLSLMPDQAHVMIAYEPVWAIGTGIAASKNEIMVMMEFIHEVLSRRIGKQIQFDLLYGGSVDTGNAREIMSLPYVDGLLVGSASLDTSKFKKIAHEIAQDPLRRLLAKIPVESPKEPLIYSRNLVC